MLNKKYRLTKKGSFNYVYKKGDLSHSKALSMLFVRSKHGVRVGFSVSSKLGKAVTRNKIKRRMRSAFFELTGRVRPSQIVFVAKLPALDLSYQEIKKTMEDMLSSSGLLISAEA